MFVRCRGLGDHRTDTGATGIEGIHPAIHFQGLTSLIRVSGLEV